MSEISEMGVVPLTGDDGPDAVLLKFFFTNPAHIPPGIDEKGGRLTNQAMDAYHIEMTKLAGLSEELAKVGRKRRERVDTGEHPVDNLSMTQVDESLFFGLGGARFYLVNVHWFEQPARAPGKKSKFVVVLCFNFMEQVKNLPHLPQEGVEALDALATTTWQFCHVWDNPNGVVTVNMVGRQPDARARHAIVVRVGILQAIEADE